MKKNILYQYEQIQESIKNNVSAIKSLLKQIDSLSELSQKMGSSDNLEEFKKSIDDTIEELMKSASCMSDQVDKLFQQSRKLVEEAFK